MKIKKRALEINSNNEPDVFTLQFSSDSPVDMGGYVEVLDHSSPENINLDRLQGGSLLVDHDRTLEKLIGVIERAWIEGSKGFCTIRFGSSELAQQIKQDVEAGIINSVSVGYKVDDYEERSGTFFVTKWTGLEVSIVAIPADPSCTVQRSEERAEIERIRAIYEASQDSPVDVADLVTRSIQDGLTVEQFRSEAIKTLSNIPAPKNPTPNVVKK